MTHGGFINEEILRVRACCIDGIALASNALKLTVVYFVGQLTASHWICYVLYSKITLKKLCFVEYNFGAIYIKKASIQSVPFCEA
tara:strand:+ start:150 stop:404 length:255 start_codon:yes stop_codon:yes gene_type:complete